MKILWPWHDLGWWGWYCTKFWINMYHHTQMNQIYGKVGKWGLKNFNENLTFVDADARGSTIALCECCSDELKRGKSPESATITNHSPSQSPRGRGKRQNKTSANRTNVQKAPRLALSSPSEVIAIINLTWTHDLHMIKLRPSLKFHIIIIKAG